MMKRPELVLPAGNLEKLKTAFLYGADAVYVGGQEFSLRAYAGNLTLPEIKKGIGFAGEKGGKVYAAVNVLGRNRDFVSLPGYLEELAAVGIDGIIVSDPGIMKLVMKYTPDIPVTVSTQASVSNYETAAFYRDLGVRRIVLARELELDEIMEIKDRVNVELEVFVHGAMCVSYSGRCLLSHYMTGRSGNRGECAHPCRYQYALMEEKRPGEYYPIHEDEKGTYILNSRDLCLIEYIPKLIDAGIDAYKIEGRMKSPLYVACAATAYRKAIDRCMSTREPFDNVEIQEWTKDLAATATRPFTNGFIEGESTLLQDIYKDKAHTRIDFCGIVKAYDCKRGMLEIEQRANFGPGDNLQIMVPGVGVYKLKLKALYDEEGNEIDRARHPKQRVFFEYPEALPEYSILRREEI